MKYKAFISYSHKDFIFAKWLHKKLENFSIPKGLYRQGSLYPIFLDKEELMPTSSLPLAIKDSLKKSDYLIVIASRHSINSYWVNEEIKFFKKLGRKDKIIILYLHTTNMQKNIPFTTTFFPQALVKKIDLEGNILEFFEEQPLFLEFFL